MFRNCNIVILTSKFGLILKDEFAVDFNILFIIRNNVIDFKLIKKTSNFINEVAEHTSYNGNSLAWKIQILPMPCLFLKVTNDISCVPILSLSIYLIPTSPREFV